MPRIIVPPFHGSLYVGLDRSNYLEPYLDMIRVLVTETARYPSIRVVDFTGPTNYHFEASTDPQLASDFWDDADGG